MIAFLFTRETPLAEGYYWVRIGTDRPEVAFIDANSEWYIAGDECPPAEVTVLSERLVCPWTMP